MPEEFAEDAALRTAAIAHVLRLGNIHGTLPWQLIDAGFFFRDRKVHLASRANGIFKPKQMANVLSIKTVYPRPGRRVWYDDQQQVHDQILSGKDGFDYAFTGHDPQHHDNQGLLRACEQRLPLIYFLATSPGRYQVIAPVFITDWDAQSGKTRVVVGIEDRGKLTLAVDDADRRYALRQVKQRLHQARFRDAVFEAYGHRCALSGFPEARLIDAAHIVADTDENLGQPVVPNGIPVTRIHHAAFDANLIGIDPNYRLHVSKQLLDQQDGPILAALKDLDGRNIRLPERRVDWPDRDRLAVRFASFESVV